MTEFEEGGGRRSRHRRVGVIHPNDVVTAGLRAEPRHRGQGVTSRDQEDLVALVAALVPRLIRARLAIVSILVVCVPLLLLKAVMFAYDPIVGQFSRTPRC